jgi:hypothetical protein
MRQLNMVSKFASVSLLLLAACGVDSTSEGNKGVKNPVAKGDEADAAAPEVHDRGFVVVHGNYETVSVTVLDTKGKVLTEHLIASGSSSAGLSLDLSGDVVLPSGTIRGPEIVLIDRTNTVLNWVNLESAEVTRQVNVGPGEFQANPYDYVEVSPTKAYVTRFGANANAGEKKFDKGSDLLILNPTTGKLTGSVDLSSALSQENTDLEPHPDTVALVGERVYVSLTATTPTFDDYGDLLLVAVDPAKDEVVDVLTLEGVKNCGEFAVSPNGERLAVSCAGTWGADLTENAGIVLVDISGTKPKVERVFEAGADLKVQPNALAFASDEVLLFSSFGDLDDTDYSILAKDGFYSLSLAKGDTFGKRSKALLETSPFNLSGLACSASEGACVLADAETDEGVIQYITLGKDGEVADLKPISVKGAKGLPPRVVGTF